jgi:hypothetical protein
MASGWRAEDKADEIHGGLLDTVTKIVGERAAVFAGETVRSDMITAFQSDHCSNSILDSLVEVVA